MSVKLNTKTYNTFGYDVLGSDLVGSKDWVHAGTKLGLSSDQVTNIFDAYQNHSFFNTARGVSGFLGKNKPVSTQIANNPGINISGNIDRRGFDIGRGTFGDDPFAELRVDNDQGFFKDKLNVKVDGDRVTYNDQQFSSRQERYGPWGSLTRSVPVATGKAGAKRSGYVLNGAFVPDALYKQLSDDDKKYYGKTFAEAKALDLDLNYGSQIVEGTYQYRRGRSRTKSGLGSVGQLASTLLGKAPIPEAAAPTPVAAAPVQTPTAESPQQITKLTAQSRRKRRSPSAGASGTILTGGDLGGSTGKTILGS